MNSEQERAAFEAWANGRCELHLVNPAGRYSSAITQFAWEAYQAGRAALAAQEAAPRDSLHDCALGDSNYAAGMLLGWNLCTDGRDDDFRRIREDRLRAAASASKEAHEAAPAAPQPAEPLTETEVMAAFDGEADDDDAAPFVFLAGVRFAERMHGIGE